MSKTKNSFTFLLIFSNGIDELAIAGVAVDINTKGFNPNYYDLLTLKGNQIVQVIPQSFGYRTVLNLTDKGIMRIDNWDMSANYIDFCEMTSDGFSYEIIDGFTRVRDGDDHSVFYNRDQKISKDEFDRAIQSYGEPIALDWKEIR